MTIFLFSTTDVRSSRLDEFERLLRSIARTAADTSVASYILLQNCAPERLASFRSKADPACRMMAIEGTVPLSTARNILFREAFCGAQPTADDIVGFPDDDCWLPDGFGAGLRTLFDDDPDLDLFLCRCSLIPERAALSRTPVTKADIAQVVRLSTSNTMYVRGSVVAAIGGFDPNLGVGTSNGGGEDTDFAIRAFLVARSCAFADRAMIGHPTPDQASAAKYFRGALSVLARHALRRPALFREFLRKLLVGVYFILRRRISPLGYVVAARSAFTSFLDRNVSFPLVENRRDRLPT